MTPSMVRRLHVKKLFFYIREARKGVRTRYVKKQKQYCRHVYKKEDTFLKCKTCNTYKAEQGLYKYAQRLAQHTTTNANANVEVIPKKLWMRFNSKHREWCFTVQVEAYARHNTQALHCAEYEAKKWKEIDKLLSSVDTEDTQRLYKALNSHIAGKWFASWEPWTCRPHHTMLKKPPRRR